MHPSIRQFAALALKRCAMDRPQEISAESFDFTDGSSINEGLQENLRRLGGFFILFMNPRKVGDAFPRVAPFGIRLGTPRRFRV
ncbi:hypothetical protein AUF78_04550 [archaeon 13_1_20CM_2_51_12]|nr:MAG: hypothetical protein AUF78_04550 [archaeon 13_1_20CM_2_51_12]